jgi:hypothetical protein
MSAKPILLVTCAVALAGCGSQHSPRRVQRADDAAEVARLGGGWMTDFARHTVPLREFQAGGPGKDGIPALTRPRFVRAGRVEFLRPYEPVVELVVGSEARAYPLQILIWHEIVDDVVDGRPVAVTFCPLCNTAIAFDRRVGGHTLTFGTTGNLRNSDLVMYDRQTESWWQQFDGEGIVGRFAGTRLRELPARIVAWREFRHDHPHGLVLSRDTGYARPYGANPYRGYDDASSPPFFPAKNAHDHRLAPKERVVYIARGGGAVAVPFSVLARRRRMTVELAGRAFDVRFRRGVSSPLDAGAVAAGRGRRYGDGARARKAGRLQRAVLVRRRRVSTVREDRSLTDASARAGGAVPPVEVSRRRLPRRLPLRVDFRRIVPAAAVAALAGAALAAPPMMSVHTGAKVRVLKPTPSSAVTGNSVATTVSITRFKLDCALAGTANRKGVGHYHIELDKSLINMFCARQASISMQNVAPGRHTLEFIPAANDHAEDMDAAKKVTFVYKPTHPLATIEPEHFAGKPSIRIVSPRSGATVHGSFDLVVAVRNFELSCALYGKANVKGYGHWHANVDTTTKGMMGMGTMLGMSCAKSFHVSLAGIKAGSHRFFAILEDNTHAPTIGAQASVGVTVR